MTFGGADVRKQSAGVQYVVKIDLVKGPLGSCKEDEEVRGGCQGYVLSSVARESERSERSGAHISNCSEGNQGQCVSQGSSTGIS